MRFKLLAHVVDGLVGHWQNHWHHWMHRRHCGSEGDGWWQLLPHCWGGSMLYTRGRWGATRTRRQDCLVEAHRRASHHVPPYCRIIAQRSRLLACSAGVVVVNVATMGVTVIPILEVLERHGGLHRMLARRRQQQIHWGFISATAALKSATG
jgi:hypothetical protein